MNQPGIWQGLPYHPISLHYKSVFGTKVYKIPVTVATTCPNREGLNGMKICNFCDAWGSAAYPDLQKFDLDRQIAESRERVKSRSNAAKFLLYFQAYTTTFGRVKELRAHFAAATAHEDIAGFVVGTRPDCISEALFDLLNEYSERYYVAVEFGVQSFDEKQLVWMSRGHTAKRAIEAIHRTKEKTKVNLGIHLILGLPGETMDDVRDTALICNTLPIDNVKLHNLHVLKGTELEKDYHAGHFCPLERDEYVALAVHFLRYLDPRIAVHRLAALSSRHDELVAPAWTAKKMETYQAFIDAMNKKGYRQGDLLSAKTPSRWENNHANP